MMLRASFSPIISHLDSGFSKVFSGHLLISLPLGVLEA